MFNVESYKLIVASKLLVLREQRNTIAEYTSHYSGDLWVAQQF